MTAPERGRGRPLSLVGSLEEIGIELQALGHERHKADLELIRLGRSLVASARDVRHRTGPSGTGAA